MRNRIKYILLSKLHTRRSPTLVPCSSKRQPGWGSGGPVVRHFYFFSPEVTDPLLFNSHDKPFPHIGASPPPTQPTCLHLKYNSSLYYISISFKNQKRLRRKFYTDKLKFTRMISPGINLQKMCKNLIFPPTCRWKLPLVSWVLRVPFGVKGHNWEKNPVNKFF